MKKPIYKKWWFWVIAVVVIFGIIGNMNNDESEEPLAGSESTNSIETPASSISSAAPDKEVVVPSVSPIDIDASFLDLSKSYFALSADDRSSTYDNFLHKHVVTWEGTVIETGKKDVYFYGGSEEYKNESWADISSSKPNLMPYTIIAELDDTAGLDKVKTGDRVVIKGSLESRGNLDPAYNWKLYSAKIESHESVEPANESTISKAEFTEIKNGMSYKEVVEIIGGEGEMLSESGEEGDEFHTVMYMYEGEGSFGANANFMFQSGKLINKAQLGLE